MTVPDQEAAVSVIVGTLILILITVTAAAGLAIMVSQLQKDEMDRQSHLAAVNGEQVEILSPALLNDPAAWSAPPFNISPGQPWNNWSSVSFTVVNLNTDDVRIVGIRINDHYTRNITVTEKSPAGRTSYNLSDEYLTVPGTKGRSIQVNFTDDFPDAWFFSTSDPVKIGILTSLTNTFEKIFSPPIPIIDVRVSSEDLGVTQKDVLFLDGNRSTADNTIMRWNWTILDRGRGTVTFRQGKTVRIDPRSAGPLSVNLTVVDDANMTSVSDTIDIPADPMFVPPAALSAQFDAPSQEILAAVRDINGDPVSNQTVSFLITGNPYGNLTLDRFYNMTDAYGTAGARCLAGLGTVRVSFQKLPAVDLTVTGP